MLEVVPARDSGQIDREIADLYRAGTIDRIEIGKAVGLSQSTVGARLTKMFRAGELTRRRR